MDLQNRENFLNKLAAKMGRPRQLVPEPMDKPLNDYPTIRLTEHNQAELCQLFIDSAKLMMVEILETSEQTAKDNIIALCEQYGVQDSNQSVMLNNDSRLSELGITQAVQQKYQTHIWSADKGDENITIAEKAKIGIVHAEHGLAETGGIVLYSGKDNGRSVSLLPEVSIVVLRKSAVLPRVAQLASILHRKAQQGERMPSCVNIISGPSSTADIELIKVVGVHGPIKKVYLLIDDL